MTLEAVGFWVGFVASIGTVLELSKIVVEYIRTTAGANDERADLINEITITSAVLAKLQSQAQLPEWQISIQSPNSLEAPVYQFKVALQNLETKLRPSRNPFVKVTSRWIWYFRKDEYQDILSKIERSKSNLMILLQQDQK